MIDSRRTDPRDSANRLSSVSAAAAAAVGQDCSTGDRPGALDDLAPACNAPTVDSRWWHRWRLHGQCQICLQWGAHSLCGSCVQRYAAAHPRCARCGLRTGLAVAACGQCLREPPPFAHTICAVDYGFPWDRLISRLKFQQQPELAQPLAQRICAAWRASGSALPQALLPVPLSAERLAARGYNQSWELARHLTQQLRRQPGGDGSDWPSRQRHTQVWPQALLRPLDTAHQADLDRRQRQSNLRAAFVVNPRWRSRLQGLHVALVDDVMTTGATLRECSLALLQAGVQQVDLWVLARTPQPA